MNHKHDNGWYNLYDIIITKTEYTMEPQNNTQPNALPRRGRHSKATAEPKHVVKPEKKSDLIMSNVSKFKFASLALGLSLVAVILGVAYSAFYVFNQLCPAGSVGSCARIPVGSLGPFFEITLLILFIVATALSALCAVESIARMIKMPKSYVSLAILLIAVVLISAGVVQDVIQKIVLRFLG